MDQQQPLVSIITPCFNAGPYIDRTIESVMSQTFQNWEMVIVDDCSTDDTRERVKSHAAKDGRIHLLELEENSGAAVARNHALDFATGRFVAFLDSDDCWKPEKLEKQLQFMQENGYAFTFTAYELMSHEGKRLNKIVAAPAKIQYHDLLKNTIIGCLTVMVDRQQTGSFQMPNIRTRQDLATWLLLLKKGFTAYGLNEELAEYRTGNPSISKNKWKALKMNWFVYRKVEKLNLVKAFWCFSHYAVHAVAKRL
ncbi:glycosyltransferase family 2 protein [Mesobacillus maritimus]|uniref:teichuronic acid biosynthesis protein TuaG n=1 Tax=Mesobacillus maritimus TaxID=1643336 RepID=UPI00203F43EB|nr:glycosyltransferase family 2 protein [Mesobacillus maritimus]MCM3585251.1 glycosyltransferase family 2 protein [Mesobacillus maritimus]MCM3668138.1 glycosyltransferase family 2 protein [Mesobacillus maritimus]